MKNRAQPPSLDAFREAVHFQCIAHPEATFNRLKTVMVLAKHANRARGDSFPGYGKIASEGHMSRSTAIRCVEWLEAANLVIAERERIGAKNRSNRYFLLVDGMTFDQWRRRGSVKTVTLGGVKAMTLGSVKLVTPEPLTEPLNQLTAASAAGVQGLEESKQEDIQQEKETELYLMAEGLGLSAGVVYRFLHEDGHSAQEGIERLSEIDLEAGENPAHALWTKPKRGKRNAKTTDKNG